MRIIIHGGMVMLFRKKIERACSYCVFSTPLEEGQFLCSKKGIRNAGEKCFRFRYDPCKRIPPKAKALDFNKFAEEDFSL